jgi:ribosome-associated protein
MLQITPAMRIPDQELKYSYVHASGSGGQNVNKVASACQLRINVRNSPSLPDEVKTRLIKIAGKKMTQEGELVIDAKRYRFQEQNRVDAIDRLTKLILKALVAPQKRRATHPTFISQTKRIESKKRKGKIKRLRSSIIE